MRQEIACLVEDLDAQLGIRDRHVHVQAEDDQRADHVLELLLQHLVALVVGDLLLVPARERVGPGARDAQPFGLEKLSQGPPHLAELVAGLVDVLADGGAHLDHRLHHLPLDLVAQPRRRLREQGVDVRVELTVRVDDLVLLLDADREQAVATHAGPSTTNVGTTLPAPAVTLRRAAAETLVMKPPARPLKR